ncbi:hypothetical protein EXS73_03060 [Candidatus Pacearchaeota archaeon]|nr:hypothetical protein [Candidatus Pacearchaeota archaeon]
MNNREFTENLAKMLNTSWNAFAEPVNNQYQKLKDRDHQMELLRSATDHLYLGIIIAMPFAFAYELNRAIKQAPTPINYEQTIPRRN